MVRPITRRRHLAAVPPRADGEPSVHQFGSWRLLAPLEDRGHPDLWLVQRDEPPSLRGQAALLQVSLDDSRPADSERLVATARRAMSARDPVLVRVLEVVGQGEDLGIVTEIVDGRSIESILEHSGELQEAFTSEIVLALGSRLLEALYDVHSLPDTGAGNLAHGSVSARSVLFTRDGAVRLAGFGLPVSAEHVPAELEWNARPPSRGDDAAFDLDALVDQFAVGLLLLQLRTDQSLRALVSPGANDSERAAAVDELLGRLDLRDPLTPVLLRMLAPNPAHRFEDAQVAADALAHLEGPFADAALRTLARKAVAGADRQDQTDPEGAPAGLISMSVPTAQPSETTERSPSAVTPSKLEQTDAQEEAGQARAVERAFYEQSNTMDALRPEQDSLPDEDSESGYEELEPEGSEDSLDVWAPALPLRAHPMVEEDSERLTSDDLERPSPEWFLDDVDEDELASTVPNGSNIEQVRAAQGAKQRRAAPLAPSRTIPYSPAFVPKAATFDPTDSGSMGEVPPGADVSGNFPGAYTSSENPELPPGAEHLLSGVHQAIAPRWTLETPSGPSTAEMEELRLEPDSSEDKTVPFAGEPATAEALEEPVEIVPDPPAGDRVQQPPRRRRRRRAQGASTQRRSLPRRWVPESVWQSSPVVRGVMLGVFLVLLIGLVEGVRRRIAPPPTPDAVPAASEPGLLE